MSYKDNTKIVLDYQPLIDDEYLGLLCKEFPVLVPAILVTLTRVVGYLPNQEIGDETFFDHILSRLKLPYSTKNRALVREVVDGYNRYFHDLREVEELRSRIH